jgi:hypothetical protein
MDYLEVKVELEQLGEDTRVGPKTLYIPRGQTLVLLLRV